MTSPPSLVQTSRQGGLFMPFLCSPLTRIASTPHGRELSPVRCKRWDCPHCHQVNRQKVISIARRGAPNALLTLTVNRNHYATPEDAAEALKRGLRLLRLRLARHPRFERFEFLAVFEKHKSGYPHLHLVIQAPFIPWKLLRRMWEGITGSYQVDIRKISNAGSAAWYVAKYIGKDLSAFQGCKRWWRSHGFEDRSGEVYEPDYLAHDCERWNVSVHSLRMLLLMEGWSLEKFARERWRATPPEGGGLPFDYLVREASRLSGHSGRKDERPPFGRAR